MTHTPPVRVRACSDLEHREHADTRGRRALIKTLELSSKTTAVPKQASCRRVASEGQGSSRRGSLRPRALGVAARLQPADEVRLGLVLLRVMGGGRPDALLASAPASFDSFARLRQALKVWIFPTTRLATPMRPP